MVRAIAVVAVLLSGPGLAPALAQTAQPYAALTDRPIKALSEQQVADLRAGRGMGLALPAELNGYPGPLHVLESADALALTPEQRARTKALFEAMKAEAVPLGERLIREEAELDGLFASKAVKPTSLEAATNAIGTTQGQLRAAHLRYHLAMLDVLTTDQVRRYSEARGYGAGGGAPASRQHGHGTHRP